jgi:hypothetical protein
MERSNDFRGGEDTRIEVYYSEEELMSSHAEASTSSMLVFFTVVAGR